MKKAARVQGVISITSKGTGYVKVEGRDIDIEIDARHLNTALHGDTVEVILHPEVKPKRQNGEISKIISRAKMAFAGALKKTDGIFFVKPDDPKMYTDILIPEKNLDEAKEGQKVFAEIVFWQDSKLPPEGKIVKIFGRAGENEAEMHAIAREKGFPEKIGRSSEEEAKRIQRRGIRPEDLRLRRDFRKILTFTIDPVDAKDFDDAISFRVLPSLEKEGVGGGELYEIGIHIADVSHYIKERGPIDREARERGTSVYLVDRTIPMLPETLSNDLCSLRPETDRLTMSAVFILDGEARVKSEWFGKTVIHSRRRFTYEEAEESIKKPGMPYHRELSILNKLAKKLTEERKRGGAISLDQEEVRFILNHKGTPIKVLKKERGDSHRLVEEFMLLANRSVAKVISREISVYRVHDLPSREKMLDLGSFLRSLGYHLPFKEGTIPSRELNRILEGLEGKVEKDTVHRAVVRSMAKAIYSTKNIGHWGLALKHYTHFTSPIRRYPDIVVHRLLELHLSGKKIGKEKLHEYEEISKQASLQEKRAQDAEWASIKYKQVEYMSPRVGQKFAGVVSGLTEWGLYVEEVETKSEGLVRMRDLSDDFYVLNEKKLELVGKRKKKKYRLGDRVKIKIKSVDLEKKTIDYVLV